MLREGNIQEMEGLWKKFLRGKYKKNEILGSWAWAVDREYGDWYLIPHAYNKNGKGNELK